MMNKKNILIPLISTACAIGVVLVYHFLFSARTIVIEERIPIHLAADRSELIATPDIFVNAAEKCLPAVVFIRSLKRIDEFYRDEYTTTSGSGVIISKEGYIITCHHVVKNADILEVILNDKREFRVRVIGTDPSNDLALLKIEDNNLPFIPFGNSSGIEIGEWVMAIGNPFGLQSSATAGIVSAKARNIDLLAESDVESLIQTDAAINPGSSGGALINSYGELIGINSALLSKSGRYEGYSFAVPSIIVQKVFRDIIEHGSVQRAWMGVSVSSIDNDLAHELTAKGLSGVKVELANQNGAAKAGGIKRNDVILSIRKISISSVPEFNQELSLYRPGDEIEVEYYRAGKIKTTKVTLRNHLNTTDLVTIRKDKILTDLGLELRTLDNIERGRMKTTGVLVVSVQNQSAASKSNMEPNYVITKCNNNRINNVAELISELQKSNDLIEFSGFYEDLPGEFPYTVVKKRRQLN